MAFQFPASPVLGQIFEPTPGTSYKWNGTGWSPYSTLFPGGGTFTGPVLHADGTVSAPGISWANDTDTGFVRSGNTNVGAVINGTTTFSWDKTSLAVPPGIAFATQGDAFFDHASVTNDFQVNGRGLFAIGTPSVPSICFTSAQALGFYFDTVTFGGCTACVWGGSVVWRAHSQHFQVVAPLEVDGSANIGAGLNLSGGLTVHSGSIAINGAVTTHTDGRLEVNNQVHINKGFSGGAAYWNTAPLRLDAQAGVVNGIAMFNVSGNIASVIDQDSAGTFRFSTTANAGPGGTGGNALLVQSQGDCYARTFNQVNLVARSNVAPLTGALASVMNLRGVRYLNDETGNYEIGLDEVEQAFPELVSATEAGTGTNYAALAAPIIEAIRELDTRTQTVEAIPKLMEQILELDARTRSTLGAAPASDITQLTGALSRVLKLRGVRFLNLDTGQSDIRLDDLALEYPELAQSDSRLTAPIVEALRELNDRLTALERQ